ncbi:MAG TPA: menaquinone biosynthesis decarboxylase [Candidatus Acidoferrales bacterium]|nr:menaquinone biosynthesis decarboxylase [Candidatus Acidoferrales bacterium]
MATDSLGEFVRALRRAGELVEISAQVDPYLEISEITDRVVKAGGPALLFTRVTGSAYPVLTNQFGSERRMAMAFGATSLDDVEQRLRRTLDPRMPATVEGKLGRLFSLSDFASAIPRTVTRAAVQDVVENEPDLRKLPVLTTWPMDGGPFITLPLVITKDPQTGAQNVGMYRVQVYDERTTGMHWQRHKQGRAQAQKWGRRVPVAIVIGADPAVTYAATAPLPPIIDEIAFAGFLRGRPVRMVRCKTIDLKVPADAEFVLEGYVDNEEMRLEGPFGDHTGVYSLADYYPTFHLQCLTRRRNPIYAATVVGKPPMEDAWLGKATERLFLPLLQMVVPEIVDYNLPVEGGFHNLAIVSIRKSYPGQAKKVMNALWGLGHMMMLTRCLVVVDADVDVQDARSVSWYVLNNLDASRDLVVMPGPVDDLDHSGSYRPALGHKLGIDATRKGADEGYERVWPAEIEMDRATRELVTARWHEYGLSLAPKETNAWSGQGPAALRRLLATPGVPAEFLDAAALVASDPPALRNGAPAPHVTQS